MNNDELLTMSLYYLSTELNRIRVNWIQQLDSNIQEAITILRELLEQQQQGEQQQ